MNDSIRIPLSRIRDPIWGAQRSGEPVRFGVPLPAGAAHSAGQLAVCAASGERLMTQARALDLWADGSVRWALVEFLADSGPGACDYVLEVSARDVEEDVVTGNTFAGVRRLEVSVSGVVTTVSTGVAEFSFQIGGSFPVTRASGADGSVGLGEISFAVEQDGRSIAFQISEVRVEERGPIRAGLYIAARSSPGGGLPSLDLFARVEMFAGSAAVRIDLTLRNTRRARHPGGCWVLGDRGSLLLDAASLQIRLPVHVTGLRAALEEGESLGPADVPFELLQESSGGDNWNSPAHRNRQGLVPLRFRGYRVRSNSTESGGDRSSPIIEVEAGSQRVAVAVPQFWQNFPRSLGVRERSIEIGLFPREFGDRHELQGGEQKTHIVWASVGQDPVCDVPLAWCHDPVFISPTPEWCCSTGAVPFLTPEEQDPRSDYLALVNMALDPQLGFVAKREAADEYGWRSFGDLPADHESAFQPPDRPFVSHYNNQYDALLGFALHFLRTGDSRWRTLMDDLARHVRDIDIYHTREDKAAYNGGLFWHTAHYMDAGTSTHRTYPAGSGGGGPSAEHNYNTGLMLHYFLTGEAASRESAIGLGQWVLDMDDGWLTPCWWLARGPTGLASATGSSSYHGPGRGAANSITACLVAYRLSGEARFFDKAEELIRRCIHPADDIEARNLFDVERRWYYTVFLQALGAYLLVKSEEQEHDEMFDYARASLIHYARWMARRERPYLDRPDLLEFPTETWAAQDLRKAAVLRWAAMYCDSRERSEFESRAEFFLDNSIDTLRGSTTCSYVRPLVLALTIPVGVPTEPLRVLPAPVETAVSLDRVRFEPLRRRAARRVIVASALLAGLAAIMFL